MITLTPGVPGDSGSGFLSGTGGAMQLVRGTEPFRSNLAEAILGA